MIGTGITPEGINQNYIMYELMVERGFYASPTNLTQWIVDYVKRRYALDIKVFLFNKLCKCDFWYVPGMDLTLLELLLHGFTLLLLHIMILVQVTQ